MCAYAVVDAVAPTMFTRVALLLAASALVLAAGDSQGPVNPWLGVPGLEPLACVEKKCMEQRDCASSCSCTGAEPHNGRHGVCQGGPEPTPGHQKPGGNCTSNYGGCPPMCATDQNSVCRGVVPGRKLGRCAPFEHEKPIPSNASDCAVSQGWGCPNVMSFDFVCGKDAPICHGASHSGGRWITGVCTPNSTA